ncbi:PTS mannitol transporter subunit IICB [Paenibacillus alkalitolerans]|uniref:PTS mannitol transporter subunit IICB n=1 Tax=Paenibacillus alkalitolerans TaxID=2799335 RepID=UPI0018F2DF47|nr:PTS mannitol transporter subunit IICB [Paenibacillus alkalitolerans]
MRILERIGNHLSTVVFQNIAALITLGLIRVLFGPLGWFHNAHVYQIVDPVLHYLVPILFAYTGGRLIGGQRGGVTAAFVTIAAATGGLQQFSLILPSLIIGPLIGYIIKLVDRLLNGRIPVGFELLLNNTAAAVVASAFSVLFLNYLDPVFIQTVRVIVSGTQYLVDSNLLPLVAFIIEPGKVLFFNNAINHGILEPLGILHTKESGTSIFFLLETNPGPGFGMLLAYYFIRRKQKEGLGNVKSSIIIHALGGIHEVYFPYALRNPLVIVSLLLGGLAGNLCFMLLGAGLVATPSPGSVFLMFVMAPSGMHLPVLAGLLASAFVSFAVAYPILSRQERREAGTDGSGGRHAISVYNGKEEDIRKIIFTCNGGLGSSAFAAAMLRKRTQHLDLELTIEHASIEEVHEDADLVVANPHLLERIKSALPDAEIWSVSSFVDDDLYDQLVNRLKTTLNKEGN